MNIIIVGFQLKKRIIVKKKKHELKNFMLSLFSSFFFFTYTRILRILDTYRENGFMNKIQ